MIKKALLITMVLSSLTFGEVINRVVAVINDTPITLFDFNKKKEVMRAQEKMSKIKVSDEEILDGLFENVVLQQEARKYGVSITDEQVDEALRERMEAYDIETKAEFAAELEKAGLTLEAFEEQIRTQLIMRVLLGQVISVPEVTDEEALEYYEEHKDDPELAGMEKITVGWIYVEVPPDADFRTQLAKVQKIEKAYKAAKGGTSFAKVASLYSEDPQSKDKGGVIGTYKISDRMPLPVKYAFHMRKTLGKGVGAVSGLQETETGSWFIKIIKIEKDEAPTFEEMKVNIKNYLYGSKVQDEFSNWLKRKVRRAIIRKF